MCLIDDWQLDTEDRSLSSPEPAAIEFHADDQDFVSSLEKLYKASYSNPSSQEKQFVCSDDNFFIVCKGTLDVSVMTSLPSEVELASTLWHLRVSGGAKVTAGIAHCLKLTLETMSCIGLVYAKIDKRGPVKLSYHKDAVFAPGDECGILTLPVTQLNEVTDYIVGVVKCPDMKPQPTGLSRLFSSSKLFYRYYYLVYFELCTTRQQCFNRWKAHILSFKHSKHLKVSGFLTIHFN